MNLVFVDQPELPKADQEGLRSLDRERCSATQTPAHSFFTPVAGRTECIVSFNRPSSETRDAVTYDEVRLAVEKLKEAGKSLSARNLRVELGERGSLSTILRHRDSYLEEQPAPPVSSPVGLSEHLLQLLGREVTRLAGERTASLEAALEDARGSVSELLKENERLHAQALQLGEEQESLQRQNAEQAGVQAELRLQVRESLAQVAQARSEGESARQDATLARERLAACEQRCARLETDLKAALGDASATREKLEQVLVDVAAARSDARALSVELASKSDAEALLADCRRQTQEQQRELEGARERLSAVEAERAGLGARLAEMKEALTRSEAHVQALLKGVLAGQPPAERGESKKRSHSDT